MVEGGAETSVEVREEEVGEELGRVVRERGAGESSCSWEKGRVEEEGEEMSVEWGPVGMFGLAVG